MVAVFIDLEVSFANIQRDGQPMASLNTSSDRIAQILLVSQTRVQVKSCPPTTLTPPWLCSLSSCPTLSRWPRPRAGHQDSGSLGIITGDGVYWLEKLG